MVEEENKNNVETQTQEEGKTAEAPAEENETKSVIETARELKDQIKAENDRREELLRREEDLYAKRMLGGRADAGQAKLTPEEEKQKQAQEEADNITNAFR